MRFTRTATVLAGAAVIALVGGTGVAVGHGLVGSHDIKNQSIRQWDIGPDQVGTSELNKYAMGAIEDAAAVNGMAIPNETFTVPAGSGRNWYGVECPEDTFVISGGYSSDTGADVTTDKPWWGTLGGDGRSSDDPNRAIGWNVGAAGDVDGGEVTVWAICAAVN